MPDISSREDIIQLVDSFYDKAVADSLIGPIFHDIARVDWVTHKPIMYNFWETLLLGAASYRGQPFDLHTRLPLDEYHFRRWVELFHATVDEHFEGSTAENAKLKASTIAHVFQNRMGIIPLRSA